MNKYIDVKQFLEDLTEDRQKQVNALREIIKATNADLTEHIKWNSPSYVLGGEDRITFNMHYPDKTMILLHMDATRKEDKKGTPIIQDNTGLIKWNSDIRGTLSFSSLNEIRDKKSKVADVIAAWLSIE